MGTKTFRRDPLWVWCKGQEYGPRVAAWSGLPNMTLQVVDALSHDVRIIASMVAQDEAHIVRSSCMLCATSHPEVNIHKRSACQWMETSLEACSPQHLLGVNRASAAGANRADPCMVVSDTIYARGSSGRDKWLIHVAHAGPCARFGELKI